MVAVIDPGSYITKCGFSATDVPEVTFRTVVGSSSDAESSSSSNKNENASTNKTFLPGRDFVVGSAALLQREQLSLSYPVQNGLTDPSSLSFSRLMEWTFSNALEVDPEAEHLAVLVTDAVHSSKSSREELCKLMFEKFQVDSFFVARQPVLSLYASGRTTGLVMESGGGVSVALPVFEGYPLSHASMRSKVAGKALDAYLSKLLSESGTRFSRAQLPIVNQIKESVAAVHPIGSEFEKFDAKEFELPDGEIISVDGKIRLACGEALFTPSRLSLSDPSLKTELGLSSLVHKSLCQTDTDLKKVLYGAIVIAGGTSMLPGYGERLARDVTSMGREAGELAEGETAVVYPDSQRKFASFIGGSMLSSLSTFKSMKITKQEYDDVHETIVHRKCF